MSTDYGWKSDANTKLNGFKQFCENVESIWLEEIPKEKFTEVV
jgi:hypothetical protein